MGKLLAAILVLIALAGGAVYYTSNPRITYPVPKVNLPTVTPSATPVTLNTTDESLDSDLSALDKDLMDLDKTDKGLTDDINSL